METIYCQLNARHVKVSGGAELVRCVLEPEKLSRAPGGRVLDFASYREKLRPAREPEAVEEPEERARPVRRESRGVGALEVLTCVAMLGVCAAAILAFLSLV